MRKAIIFILGLCIIGIYSVYAQEESSPTLKLEILKIDASKQYENNTRTSYVTLNKSVDINSSIWMNKKMEQYPEIHRFSFWNKSDYRKFMFTSDVSITEEEVVKILNRELASLPFKAKSKTDDQTSQQGFEKKERISVDPSELKQLKPTIETNK